MNQVVSQAACFRHVVFPDSAGGYGRALNLAPPRRFDAETLPRTGPDGAPLAMTPEARAFLRWLLSRARLDSDHYKPETLLRRLPACLRAIRAISPAHARSLLHHNPALLRPAVGALLIGVTSLFRDDHLFISLQHRTLPGLLRHARHRPLRVWCAGCSDGAELYSVAILLAELGALDRGRVELLGTDVRPDALERAQAGIFDATTAKNVPPALLSRYFTFSDNNYHTHPTLRAAARWRRADVLSSPEPGPWDLVFCRNLAIYLRPDAATRLWQSLSSVLRPGGVLVPGKAERPIGIRGLTLLEPCLYQRRSPIE